MNGLLQEALAALGLTGAKAEFLQHNENLTYRVDGRYLLHIHKAAEGLHVPQHQQTIRLTEMAFLQHLRHKGIQVQTPVSVSCVNHTYISLLTWLPGQALTRDTLTPELLCQAGQLAFRMHDAARGFPHTLQRTYGASHIMQLADVLISMADRYAVPTHEAEALLNACEVVSSRLAAVEDAFIPIHADLSASNLLLTPDGLAPIDFSLMGLGHPMHDLGILMGNIGSHAQRQAVAGGYVSAGGCIELPLLDAGLALGLLEALAFHAETWPKEPWFAPRLTRWTDEMLLPLSQGKPLLDENMYLIHLK